MFTFHTMYQLFLLVIVALLSIVSDKLWALFASVIYRSLSTLKLQEWSEEVYLTYVKESSFEKFCNVLSENGIQMEMPECLATQAYQPLNKKHHKKRSS